MTSGRIHTIPVPPEADGKRLDVFLTEHLPECSRSFIANLIQHDRVFTGEARVRKAGVRVRSGECIRIDIPEPEPIETPPEPIPIHPLYEDEAILVLDKQPGLVVHPAPGHASGTLVNAILFHCSNLASIGGKIRPGIVHRLDKDTSGVLVVAKSDTAQNGLAIQFKQRLVRKTYVALVCGRMNTPEGRIDLPIGRHPVDRKKMSVHAAKSRKAVSCWRIQERFEKATLLEIDIQTGRTHQIRVHLSAIGHPIAGDAVYGRKMALGRHARLVAMMPRPMLHAWKLAFHHPVTGDWMSFCAPIPTDMAEILGILRMEASS
ncbi:RluA family pseudouridine synthase [Desulfatirhabdium butyrativorans]|uniref:RluA family pseudouridine synthase n=1 Tax=Desulfatirhabdium butyrativorans TaxID=340467 RepID=UPI000684AF98|nr:RluA family pseudouridine synthase [Desulfatirhabdium butyrativorans]